ncbi:MAG: hypothetical protein ABSH51_18420 [Solirubrobacteraceae bacterium]
MKASVPAVLVQVSVVPGQPKPDCIPSTHGGEGLPSHIRTTKSARATPPPAATSTVPRRPARISHLHAWTVPVRTPPS